MCRSYRPFITEESCKDITPSTTLNISDDKDKAIKIKLLT